MQDIDLQSVFGQTALETTGRGDGMNAADETPAMPVPLRPARRPAR